MHDNDMAADPATAGPSSRRLPVLVQWELVSVRRYDNGSLYASHGRFDTGSRRMVVTQLCDPDPSYPGQPWAVGALVMAAEELALDHEISKGAW